MGGNREFLMRT